MVVTADHGESLGEGGRFGYLTSLHQPELRIPLWVHETQPTLRERRFARQIDVAPTIVAALGPEPPFTWEGVPLQQELKAATSVHFIQSMPHHVAVVNYDGSTAYKLLVDRATTQEQLFEILGDPFELRDILWEADVTRVTQMRTIVRRSLVGRDQAL